jgi:hypothetical protein
LRYEDPRTAHEERSILTSKFLLSIAAAAAALMPLTAVGQVAPEHQPDANRKAPNYKYEAFAGFAYSNLDQVTQSRHGLMGAKIGVTREFGKHFGVTANGDYYRWATSSGNPGSPTVISITAGPELRSTLYGNVDGFIHVLLGGEHTGGVGVTPDISFSAGVGGGLLYNLSERLAIRVAGDRMSDSFSVINNSSSLGNSPHTHYNARATVGVQYRF